MIPSWLEIKLFKNLRENCTFLRIDETDDAPAAAPNLPLCLMKTPDGRWLDWSDKFYDDQDFLNGGEKPVTLEELYRVLDDAIGSIPALAPLKPFLEDIPSAKQTSGITRSNSYSVWAFAAIVNHLSVKYGYEHIFVGVQEIIRQIFNDLSESADQRHKNCKFIIWIEDEPTYKILNEGGRRIAQWRFFISSNEPIVDVVNRISAIVNQNIGWTFHGKQSILPRYTSPLFEYSNGEFSVFFVKEAGSGSKERVGYLDIDNDGIELKLVFVEMEEKPGNIVLAEKNNPNSMKFKVKYIQDVIGDENVTIVSPEPECENKEIPSIRSKAKIEHKIFFINRLPEDDNKNK